MFFTFNDFSAKCNSITSEFGAKTTIESLVSFCKSLISISAIDEIVFPETFFSCSIYNGYSISNWINDSSVSKSHRQYFKRFLDKYRRYYGVQDIDGEFQITIDNNDYISIGCTFAYEHNHTLLSLPTNSFWENKSICGEYSSVNENGDIQKSNEYVDNVWTSMDSGLLSEYIRKEISVDIFSGQDLWEKRESLYPNLIFCENTKFQLFEDSEKYHILAVMKRLERFQEYFSTCDNQYNPNKLGMNARTESDTVKADDDLKKYRLFKMPDGNEEYFFDHVSFSGKYTGGRIYFLPDNKNKKCYIGYIGRHLPTKKY